VLKEVLSRDRSSGRSGGGEGAGGAIGAHSPIGGLFGTSVCWTGFPTAAWASCDPLIGTAALFPCSSPVLEPPDGGEEEPVEA
jgi:hypothetical protein